VSGFLGELGKSLADRWLQALVLPGLLWTALCVAAADLGQRHPFDFARLSTDLDRLAARPAVHAPGTVLLAGAAILLVSAAVGMAAGAGGKLIQALWALPGNQPPASWLLSWRLRRWNRAAAKLKAALRQAASLPTGTDPRGAAVRTSDVALAQARVRRRQRRLDHLGRMRAVRPTRVGDRFAHTSAHIAEVDGLVSVEAVWSRLWSVLPDKLRTDITAARTSYTAASCLAAWAVLYSAVTIIWWPAVAIGVGVSIAATIQARATAGILADLVEAAADLHTTDLAKLLNLSIAGLSLTEIGLAVTNRLTGAEQASEPMGPVPAVPAPTPSADPAQPERPGPPSV
jgi:hypothetical protein